MHGGFGYEARRQWVGRRRPDLDNTVFALDEIEKKKNAWPLHREREHDD
jgi:hypothetical protein